MIADFKILNDADIITRRRLVIWGAGSNGKEMANALKNYTSDRSEEHTSELQSH